MKTFSRPDLLPIEQVARRGANDHFAVSRRWSAGWIWDGRKEPNVVNLFRRTFDWAGGAATLHVAACSWYRLFVNGECVLVEGGILSQPFHTFYDSLDLSPHLRTGTNCIGIQVYFGGGVGVVGGLLVELEGDNGSVLLATSPEWQVHSGTAWKQDSYHLPMNHKSPYQEHCDLRRLPQDWSAPDFSVDESWRSAKWVDADGPSERRHFARPWCRLLPREIPFMQIAPVLAARLDRVEECQALVSRARPGDKSISLSQTGVPLRRSRVESPESLLCEAGETVLASTAMDDERRGYDGAWDPCITLDFDEIYTAYLCLEVSGPAGAVVEVGYAERLIDGFFNIAIECSFADSLTLDGARRIYIPMHWRCFRFLRIRVRGAFDSPVVIHRIQALRTFYPFEYKGQFLGDSQLEQIARMCQATVHLCAHESIMDTPWRESAQWLGDVAAVTNGGIYSFFGDSILAGKFFRQSAANMHPNGLISNVSNGVNQNFYNSIPDYSLWWIIGLWDHYRYTGDLGWVREYYPQALRIIQAHLDFVNELGLVENMPHWVFIDWANVRKGGMCAAYNAIFAGALESFKCMASMMGDSYWMGRAAQLHEGVKSSFQRIFWDSGQGYLLDSVQAGGVKEGVSEHSNLAAIRWGLVDDEGMRSIIERFYGVDPVRYVESQPFFMVVVLKALRSVGRVDLAVRLIRERWGERMLAAGNTSCNEEWGCNGTWRQGRFSGVMRTQSHAWSAYAGEFLLKELMGLEIVEPGGSVVRIDPWIGDFDYKATYPLHSGSVTVSVADGAVKVTSQGVVIRS